MPCFNAAPFVRAAIESVLAQTWTDFELIVTDDGSTDGTFDAVSAVSDTRLRIMRAHGKGAAAARNQAFAVSTGDLILFLDADDLIGPRHLEALEARIDRRKCFISQSRWDRFRDDPAEARFPDRSTEADLSGADWLIRSWADARPMMQCGMMLIPRILIEAHGGWDERLSLIDDFEFFARILSRCDGVRFAPEARLYYRSGLVGSLSGRKSRRAVESHLLSLMLGTGHLLAVHDSVEARRVCAGLLQDFDHSHYPDHPDLRAKARARVTELGGSSIEPDGPPGFHAMRRFVGWRLARRFQRYAEAYGWNAAGRARRREQRIYG